MTDSSWTWRRKRLGLKWHYCSFTGRQLCGSEWLQLGTGQVEQKDNPSMADRCERCMAG